MSSNFGAESLTVAENAPGNRALTGGGAQVLPPSRSRRRGIGWAQRLEIALLSGPAILMFFAFVIFPVAALVLIAFMIGPVLYIITGGFRSNSQITINPAGLPDPWQFDNYADVLTSSRFWRQVGSTTIAAVSTTIGILVLGVMASYVLARYQFRGRGAMYALFAAGLMFPITVALRPCTFW